MDHGKRTWVQVENLVWVSFSLSGSSLFLHKRGTKNWLRRLAVTCLVTHWCWTAASICLPSVKSSGFVPLYGANSSPKLNPHVFSRFEVRTVLLAPHQATWLLASSVPEAQKDNQCACYHHPTHVTHSCIFRTNVYHRLKYMCHTQGPP